MATSRILLGQGAEAFVYLDGDVVKERPPKRYRSSKLDETLRKSRTRREAKIMAKLFSLIPVPSLVRVDDASMTITMTHIPGELLRLALSRLDRDHAVHLFVHIGKYVSLMHAAHIVHDDLTTSNMIYTGEDVVLIDFGLAFVTQKIEDMAVDLHLFRQALESAHHSLWQDLWPAFLRGYSLWEGAPAVLGRLEKVDSRGRYKRRPPQT